METKDYLKKAVDYFNNNGFMLNPWPDERILNGSTRYYLEKKGKVLMGLLPYVDHIFLHELNADSAKNKDIIIQVHDKERDFVNAQIKTPKTLRLKIPNIISVFFTKSPFNPDIVEYIKSNTTIIKGGEAHSVFLIDIPNRSVISQGTKETYVMGTAGLMHLKFKQTDPFNRAYYHVHNMFNDILNNQ